jgi:hypothetical protein
MRHSSKKRTFILGAVAALLLAVAIPSTVLAQGNGHGKGHGRNRDNGDWSNRIEHSRSNWDWRNRSGRNRHYNKKCGKFVNCHDARAGRWDGRGPRGTWVGNNVGRNRDRNRNVETWRYRNGRTARRVIVNPYRRTY